MRLNQRVYDETLRFEAKLPELLKTMYGKYVVFLDGEVKSVHDHFAEAFASAVDHFGHDGGFVVAPVRERSATVTSFISTKP